MDEKNVMQSPGRNLSSSALVRYLRNDERVRYYSPRGLQANRHIAAVYRSDHYLSKDATTLISLLQRQARLV